MSTRKNVIERRVRSNGKPRPLDVGSKLLLNYEDVASLLDMAVGTLRNRVRAGTGPNVTIVGKHHRFAPQDVNRWVDLMRANSGADQ